MPYRLFEEEHRPGGVTKRHWFDEKGNHVEETIQDVEPVLDDNKRAANSYEKVRGDHFIRAASIPPIIVLKWMNEGVNVFDPNCDAEVRRRLNSNEWAYLRTAPGRL